MSYECIFTLMNLTDMHSLSLKPMTLALIVSAILYCMSYKIRDLPLEIVICLISPHVIGLPETDPYTISLHQQF